VPAIAPLFYPVGTAGEKRHRRRRARQSRMSMSQSSAAVAARRVSAIGRFAVGPQPEVVVRDRCAYPFSSFLPSLSRGQPDFAR
jgi:hypothetical protein